MPVRNILSVDVEEYFHPSEVQRYINSSMWHSLPSRIENQTARILDLFAKYETRATFFVVGWIAERHPRVVRAIARDGHEVACHSHLHRLVYDLSASEFRRDTFRSISAIADATGVQPRAYRAPSYSITDKSMWALEVLVELGFTHDSSIYPITHDRYGVAGFPRHAHTIMTPSGPICEVPIATVQLANDRVAPVGGGAYLRLLPYRYTAAGIRRMNDEEQQPACIYFHPWEIDPSQPRLTRSVISSLRTYSGISGMFGKIERLLRDFRFSTIAEVHAAAEQPKLRAIATVA